MKTWQWILIIVGILILLFIWKKGRDAKNQNNSGSGGNSNTGNLGGGSLGSVGTAPGNLDPQIG